MLTPLALPWLLLACSDDKAHTEDSSAPEETGDVEDIDADGYTVAGGDCDDTNADISPAAPEVCDGLDNNCDGSVDGADAVDAILLYPDADSDGYGADTEGQASCTSLSGMVEDSSDCDDTRADISPEGQEICDALDNDCAVGVDDGDVCLSEGLVLHYPLDGDGRDLSGSGADAEAVGEVSASTDRRGVKGGAVFLDQSAGPSYYRIPGKAAHAALSTLGDSYTLSAWMRVDGHASVDYPTIFEKLEPSDTSAVSWCLHFNTSYGYRKILFFEDSTWPAVAEIDLPTAWTTESWTHFAVAVGPTETTFYVNGVAEGGALPNSGGFTSTSAEWALLGGSLGGADEFLQGALDDIRIYDRTLTAEEVLRLVDLP